MTAAAFFSYVHRDDEDDQGGISHLCDRLCAEWSLHAGEDRELWMDRSSLNWGDDWEEHIDQALLQTSFFIPIVTPRYFRSEACRGELVTFASSARRLGLEELILPIYYMTVPDLDVSDDEAMDLVRRYQYEDWRTTRTANTRGSTYRSALARLAGQLLERESVADAKPSPVPSAVGTSAYVGATIVGDPDQPGLLDVLAAGEEAIGRIAPTVTEVSELIRGIAAHLNEATAAITKSDSQKKGFAGRVAVSRRLAAELQPLADRLSDLTKDYVADVIDVDAMQHEIFRLAEAEAGPLDDDVSDYLRSLVELAANVDEGMRSGADFADQLKEGKAWSKDLRGPISQLESAMRQFVDTRGFFSRWAANASRLLDAASPATS